MSTTAALTAQGSAGGGASRVGGGGASVSRPLSLSGGLLSGSGSALSQPSPQGSRSTGTPGTGLVQQFTNSSSGSTSQVGQQSRPAGVGPSSAQGGSGYSLASFSGSPSSLQGGSSGGNVSNGVVLNVAQSTSASTLSRQLAPAKAKMDELFQFWLQREETVDMLQRMAAEATAQLLGNGSGSGTGNAAAAGQKPLVISESDDEFEEPAAPAEDAAAGLALVDAPHPTTASPPNGMSTHNPRRTPGGTATTMPAANTNANATNSAASASAGSTNGNMVNIAVSMEDLPSDLGGFSLGTANGAQPKTPKRGAGEDAIPVSPGRHHHTPPTRTPREGVAGAGALKPASGPHLAVVDEMDMAHRAGALSPRAISPNAPMGMLDGPTRSPFDINLRSPRIGAFSLDQPGAPPKSRSPSPQAGARANQQNGSSPPSGAQGFTAAEDSDRENTPRQTGSAGVRRRSATSSLASSFSSDAMIPTAKPPVATLNDIPQFYFGKGRPVTLKATLAEDVCQLRNGGSSHVMSTSSNLFKPSSQPSAITNPQEEREIAAIQRIVANVNAAATNAAKRPTASRLTSAPKGRPGSSAGPAGGANSEATQLQAVRQLCTDAFGIPHVLAPLVAPRVLRQPGNQLTVASARAFYDLCIAKQCESRRIFEALLGSSPQAPAQDKAGHRRNYLVRDDFIPLLHSLVEHHPGLTFLKEAADFQTKYVDTVLLRIFYDCDLRDTGRITWEAFNHSELPGAIKQLALTDEINQVLAYFSYEHFYVLYCRFWELDSDKDLQINAADLSRYFPEGTANDLIIERIFSGAGRKLQCKTKGRMGYDDFVMFCISDEDKASTRALTYWFRILDTDGDGIISGHELASVYEVTRARLEQLTGEAISFPDVMCQISDMLRGPVGSSTSSASSSTPTGSSAAVGQPWYRQQSTSGTPSFGSGLDLMHRIRRQHLSRPPSPGVPNAVVPLASSASLSPAAASAVGASAVQGSFAKPPQSGGSRNQSSRGSAPPVPGGVAFDPLAAGFTLGDFLRRPHAAAVAISMLTNVAKFLQYEQRDPFVVHHERSQGPERNDWDRFCRAEYDRMSLAEEEG